MKKSSKFLALLMAVVLLVSAFPFSAYSATTLSKTENKASNAEYYSITLQNNSGNPEEYISFQYTGVDKATKTLTVTEYEPITITMDDGNGYTGQNGEQNGYALGWYYTTDSNNRCISTENFDWSMTDGTHNFQVSGFGVSEANWCKPVAGNSCETTFTLNEGLPEGEYNFTVSYKFQMKKYSSGIFGIGGSWGTEQEITTSDVIKINVVKAVPEEYYPNVEGGSIRVGAVPGLRFGFTTDEDATNIEQYGFLYAVGAHDTLTEGAEGVTKVVAENFITHNEDTDAEYTSFNLVFTGIPSSAFNNDITVCSYVVIDGETYYSDPVTRNFTQVANYVLADPDVDQPTKDAVSDLLGNN